MQARIIAAVAGGLLIASGTFGGAMAQDYTNVAYAPASPRGNYVVFVDQGARLTDAGSDTVKQAADRARSASQVRLVGQPAYAQAVKQALVRDGVPESSIVVLRADPNRVPLITPNDPVTRKVEIHF